MIYIVFEKNSANISILLAYPTYFNTPYMKLFKKKDFYVKY